MSAEIIDFTAEALHRRWETLYAQGLNDECAVLSVLIEGYLEGELVVTWQNGEPYFESRDASSGLPWDLPEIRAFMGLFEGARPDDS